MEHYGLFPWRVGPSGSSDRLFVHDFAPVDLPLDAVIGAFTHYVSAELIGGLVVEGWRCQLDAVGRTYPATPPPSGHYSVRAVLGQRRPRQGALVIPVSWQADSENWIPGLEADLELVGFGPSRTHLHLMGVSALSIESVPYTERASLEHRLTVALVRSVLDSLGRLLAERVPGHPSEPDGSERVTVADPTGCPDPDPERPE